MVSKTKKQKITFKKKTAKNYYAVFHTVAPAPPGKNKTDILTRLTALVLRRFYQVETRFNTQTF